MRLRVICKAQEQMKKSANKHCRKVTFDKRDQLYLKLQSYRFHSLASCLNEKLSPRFYGPFYHYGKDKASGVQTETS